MIKYKVEEIAADPLDSLIVKTGADIKFTIRSIDNDVAYLEKMKTELVAKSKIEEAKKSNVLRTHPHIEQMSEEDRVACYLYQESFAFCKVAVNKLKEIDKQLQDYKEEKAEIVKQVGIKLEYN